MLEYRRLIDNHIRSSASHFGKRFLKWKKRKDSLNILNINKLILVFRRQDASPGVMHGQENQSSRIHVITAKNNTMKTKASRAERLSISRKLFFFFMACISVLRYCAAFFKREGCAQKT